MLIVTTEAVAGFDVRSVLGDVLGTAVQADQGRAPQHGAAGSSGTFRMPGEQPAAGPAAARREAVDRLGEEARRKGANTVVGMRFDTVPIGGGAYEVCAYGTAVWAEPAAAAPHEQAPPMPQHGQVPPYPDAPGGPPMAARNLTMGIHDRPR